MRRLYAALPALCVLLTLSEARADLAPGPGFRPRPPFQPNPQPVVPPVQPPAAGQVDKMPLVVEIDNRIRIPRLQIPRSLLKGAGGAQEGAAPADPAAPEFRQGVDAGPRRLPMLMAGLALALSFASGGLWLLRRKGGRPLVTAGVGLGILLLGGAALWADGVIGPFPRPQPGFPQQPGLPPQPFPQPGLPAQRVNLPQLILPAGILLPANIEVEVVEKGQALKLIVSRNLVFKATGIRPAAPAVPGNPLAPGE